jgi:hypothetical protein
MLCAILPRSLGGAIIDVVVSEKGESEMEIAAHPVERSAEITDHAWRKPRKVTISGVTGQGAVIAAHEAFLALQERPQLMTVVTGLKVYDNMLLQSLSTERDAEYGRVLKFDAVLQEVIIVSTQSGPANAQNPQEGVSADRAKAGVNRGEVQLRQSSTTTGLSQTRSETILNNYTAR